MKNTPLYIEDDMLLISARQR